MHPFAVFLNEESSRMPRGRQAPAGPALPTDAGWHPAACRLRRSVEKNEGLPAAGCWNPDSAALAPNNEVAATGLAA